MKIMNNGGTRFSFYQYRCDLKRRLTRALDLEPDNDHGIRLRKRYGSIQDHLFVFLEDTFVPPTNNSRKQAILMSTVFRKVTNCFRSQWGRELFTALRSVVNIGKRQDLTVYQVVKKALLLKFTKESSIQAINQTL